MIVTIRRKVHRGGFDWSMALHYSLSLPAAPIWDIPLTMRHWKCVFGLRECVHKKNKGNKSASSANRP
jgi:hypothetical protein